MIDMIEYDGEDKSEDALSHAEVRRWYQERGAELSDFQFMTARRNGRDYFPYEIRIRYPVGTTTEFLLVLKVATEDGPQVLFHTAPGLLQVITSLAGRLRSGHVNWKQDEYPPSNYNDVWANIQTRFKL